MSRPVNLRDYERKKAESALWESKYIEVSKENNLLKARNQKLEKLIKSIEDDCKNCFAKNLEFDFEGCLEMIEAARSKEPEKYTFRFVLSVYGDGKSRDEAWKNVLNVYGLDENTEYDQAWQVISDTARSGDE